MTIIAALIENVKEHPFTSGMIASISTQGVSIVAYLSNDATVRLIGSIGGLLGILLTLISIYYKIKNQQTRRRR